MFQKWSIQWKYQQGFLISKLFSIGEPALFFIYAGLQCKVVASQLAPEPTEKQSIWLWLSLSRAQIKAREIEASKPKAMTAFSSHYMYSAVPFRSFSFTTAFRVVPAPGPAQLHGVDYAQELHAMDIVSTSSTQHLEPLPPFSCSALAGEKDLSWMKEMEERAQRGISYWCTVLPTYVDR